MKRIRKVVDLLITLMIPLVIAALMLGIRGAASRVSAAEWKAACAKLKERGEQRHLKKHKITRSCFFMK